VVVVKSPPGSALTDDNGLVQAYWALGEGPTHELSVAPTDPDSDVSPVTITATNELVLSIEVVSGAGQSAVDGQPLPEPVTIRVEDFLGRPAPAVGVAFEVIRGGGRVDEAQVTSGSSGTAQVSWVMGSGPDNRLEVRVLDDVFRAPPLVVSARTEM